MSAARKLFDVPEPTLSVVGRTLDIVDQLNIVGRNGIRRRLVAGDDRVRAYSVAELRKLRSIRARRGPLPDDRAKVLPFSPPLAAASIVQTPAHGNSGAAATFSTIAATWGSATTAGSTLFAIFGFQGSVTGAITLPAAWSAATEVTGSPWTFSTNCTLRVLQLNNAASQSGAQTFTISGSTAGLILVEAGGLGTSATLDSVSAGANPSSINDANSSTPATNAMTCNAGSTDLYLACFVAGGTGGGTLSFSTPTNSFGNLVQDGSAHGTVPKSSGYVALTYLIGNAGSTSTGLTLSGSTNWIAILLSYKAATAGGLVQMPVTSYPGVWNTYRANPFDLLP